MNIETTRIESKIVSEFSGRKYPELLTQRGKTRFADEEDVAIFADRTWQEIKQKNLDHASYALYHFSDDAFCYFLPGILIASIRSNFSDSLVYDVLVDCFTDSPGGFWSSRLDSLTRGELEAIREWLVAFRNSESRFDLERINLAIEAVDDSIAQRTRD